MASASSWSCVTMMVVMPEAALQRLDLVAQAHAHARIERGERLVQQQQRGRGGERAGERHALLLPARQLGRILGALLGHADQLQQLAPRARRSARAALAPVDEAVADVLRHGQVGEQRVGLEDDAEVALRRRQMRHVAAGDLDAAGVLRLEPGDHAQQRGLAAARGAEEADELALLHLQRDVVERGEGAEALGHRPDAQVHGAGDRRATARCALDVCTTVSRARLPSALTGRGWGGVNPASACSRTPDRSPDAGTSPGMTTGIARFEHNASSSARPWIRSASTIRPACARGRPPSSGSRPWPCAPPRRPDSSSACS